MPLFSCANNYITVSIKSSNATNYKSINLNIQTDSEKKEFIINPLQPQVTLPIQGKIKSAKVLETETEGIETHHEILYFNPQVNEIRIYIVDFQQEPFVLNSIDDEISVPEIPGFDGMYTAFFNLNGEQYRAYSRTASFKPQKLITTFDRRTLSASMTQYKKSDEEWNDGGSFSFQDPEEGIIRGWVRD